jgi:hypothetical protein
VIVIVVVGLAIIASGIVMQRMKWTMPEWPGDDEYLNVPPERRTFIQHVCAVWAPHGMRRSYAARRRTSARDTMIFGALFVVLGILGLVFLSDLHEQ